jgi:hypothetical protein
MLRNEGDGARDGRPAHEQFSMLSVVGERNEVNPMSGKKTDHVTVDKIAQAFGISERAVQRLVIYEHMPRVSRGEYDLTKCLAWYCHFLHERVCGCAGPCAGFDIASRNTVNARAERRQALREVADLAPDLVGLKAEAIRTILKNAIENTYDQ